MRNAILGLAAVTMTVPALPTAALAYGSYDGGRYGRYHDRDDDRRYSRYYDRRGYYHGPTWRGGGSRGATAISWSRTWSPASSPRSSRPKGRPAFWRSIRRGRSTSWSKQPPIGRRRVEGLRAARLPRRSMSPKSPP